MAKKIPFYDSVIHQVNELGIPLDKALENTQANYARFKDRNELNLNRQLDQSNSRAENVLKHLTLLATLTLTSVGLLVSQFMSQLTLNLKVIFILIIIFEVISVAFSLVVYFQDINFFKKWAKVYKKIDIEVDKAFAESKLQKNDDLGKIEAKYVNNLPEQTNQFFFITSIILCLIGLLLVPLLFYGFFFDAPFIK